MCAFVFRLSHRIYCLATLFSHDILRGNEIAPDPFSVTYCLRSYRRLTGNHPPSKQLPDTSSRTHPLGPTHSSNASVYNRARCRISRSVYKLCIILHPRLEYYLYCTWLYTLLWWYMVSVYDCSMRVRERIKTDFVRFARKTNKALTDELNLKCL